MIVEVRNNTLIFDDGGSTTLNSVQILTGSRSLIGLLRRREGRTLNIRRSYTGKLFVMDTEFIVGERYKMLSDDGTIYKCMVYHEDKHEAIMRPTNRPGRGGLMLARSVDTWVTHR